MFEPTDLTPLFREEPMGIDISYLRGWYLLKLHTKTELDANLKDCHWWQGYRFDTSKALVEWITGPLLRV